ncbi:MAG: DNA alkylation repair protein [Flavobacteriaceae bacterium]|nr:DNA alkylation repair protein [Flavobacteriaceae bacterium]
MLLNEILLELKSLSNPEIKAFKAKKYGINCDNSWGVYQKDLSALAKKIGKNTTLGIQLFETGNYDAQLLCAKICIPNEIPENLMGNWITFFNTWEICDSFCMQLFKYHPLAIKKALSWSQRTKEFEKRAGFVLMATYGFADKVASNEVFEQFFPFLIQHAQDDRIYVKKAINWALRQIGKRNIDLQKKAIITANLILKQDSKSAHWIAKNALKELQNKKINILDYPRSIYRK